MSALPASSWPHSAEQWLERLSSSRWTPIAANVLAFALLAYGLGERTYRLWEPVVPAGFSAGRPPASNEPTSIDVQPMLAANLFGQLQATSVDPEQIPLSSLNLVLTGVMARGGASFAFLSINGAPEMFVSIGQEVTAGVTLEHVYSDRIVLRRGATLESVLLKGSDAILPAGSIVMPGSEKAISVAPPRARVPRTSGTLIPDLADDPDESPTEPGANN